MLAVLLKQQKIRNKFSSTGHQLNNELSKYPKGKEQNAKQCVQYATAYVKKNKNIYLYMLVYASIANAYDQYKKYKVISRRMNRVGGDQA